MITALAWAYLVHLDRQMSADMEAMAAMGMAMSSPWTATDVLFAFIMWAVMMVGMMAPAAAPVLVLFAAAHARRDPRVAMPVLLFGLGYAVVWTGFSVGAAFVQWALQLASMLSATMSASRPHIAGVILVAVGVYQLTPFKSRCLTHCRSPLGFLMTNWRDGRIGAISMGLRHGVYCLGCCWALMCCLFVVGVMNLVWVAALTAFVFLEKVGRAGAGIARFAGALMILLGVFQLVRS